MANIDVLCIAAGDKTLDMKPVRLQRRPLGDNDVLIDMKFCGICHSDLHIARGDLALLGKPQYPFVPGHELSGIVSAVGSKVTKFKVGDQIGVGCMVDSCMSCAACHRGEEQKCSKQVSTYNGKDLNGRAGSPCGYTLGGYTTRHVVTEHFGIKIPAGYPLEAAGPVMCSGVTLYDPMRRYGAGPGTRVGIIGLGGLGSIGIKIAKALGCTVTAVTRSASKAEFAKKCGADAVVVSSDSAAMAAAKGSIDLLLNTIPAEHDYLSYQPLVSPKGKQVMLGLNTGLVAGMAVDAITCHRSRVVGSGIGGIAATQEVVDLCAKHGILPETKLVGAAEVNRVYEELDAGNDDGRRNVLDIATLNDGVFEACKGVPPPKLDAGHSLSLGGVLGGIFGLLFSWRR